MFTPQSECLLSTSLTCLFVAMVSPPLKYIFLLLAWMFFYLSGLEPVAPRARFKCVWVFKDFSAEKLFGLQPHCHTSATELCHFRFLSHRWNQRKVQKRNKKNTTQKLMKMDQIGLCQTWHVPRYEGSLRSVLSHSALQLNEL